MAKGWICPRISPYGAPVLLIRKQKREIRMCIDFKSLNANTRLDVFPLPRIADLLDKLGKAMYFSRINLALAYHKVRISAGDTYKTAFLTIKGYIST